MTTDQTAMPELLCCPFCGKKPDLDDRDTLYPSGTCWRDNAELEMRTYHCMAERREGDGMCYGMHCPVQAGGCGAEIHGDSIEEAIAAWNRRAAIQALTQQSDPVLYQYRMRASWLPEGEGWTEWTDCSAEAYKDHERLPLYNGWQTEVRKLYAHPCASKDAERYKQQRDRLLDFIKRAPVSSGVCCCGDSMDKHPEPMMCGHSPVDQWDDAVSSMVREIEQADAALTNNGENNV